MATGEQWSKWITVSWKVGKITSRVYPIAIYRPGQWEPFFQFDAPSWAIGKSIKRHFAKFSGHHIHWDMCGHYAS